MKCLRLHTFEKQCINAMPIYLNTITEQGIRLLVWEITENLDELREDLTLSPHSLSRLSGMKSESHQKAFVSVRQLLQHAGFSDNDLYYTPDGKPHLTSVEHLSISHASEFSAIAISPVPIGIDLEKQRSLVCKLGPRFCTSEYNFLNPKSENYLRELTVIWGVKESVFKIVNQVGISYMHHIHTLPFDIYSGKAQARLDYEGVSTFFNVHYLDFKKHTLVYLTYA
jgi:4'-phosphopantetheinyl transferase